MITFKKYIIVLEKRKKKSKKKKKQAPIPGIYGMPLYWNSYPVGGFVEVEGGESGGEA